MFKQDKRLKRLYLKYNRLYWDNLLPLDTLIGYDEGTTNCAEVNVLEHEEGKKVFVVHLNPKEIHSLTDRCMHLLHECCHIRLYPVLHHGKVFQEEMIRIAVRGAFKGLW